MTNLRCAAICIAISLLGPAMAFAQQNAALAQQHYSLGVQLFGAGRYAEALDEFRASLQTFASPNARLLVARTLVQLQRNAEAVAEYELTIREAADRAQTDVRYLETRRAAETELVPIETRIGRLRVSIPNAPPGVHVYVGDREIPAGALGIALAYEPGVIHVRAEAENFAAASQDVTLAAGDQTEVVIPLEPVVPPPAAQPGGTPRAAPVNATEPHDVEQPRARWTGPRIALAVSAAATLAGFVTFGGLWGATSEWYGNLSARCNYGSCPDSARGDIATGRTLEVFTNVALGVGLVGLAALATFVVVTVWQDRQTRTLSIALTPTLFGVGGRF